MLVQHVDELMQHFRPTLLAFECALRVLNTSLYVDDHIARALWAPLYFHENAL